MFKYFKKKFIIVKNYWFIFKLKLKKNKKEDDDFIYED